VSSCGICGQIGAEESWGEANPWMLTKSTPAPANFERLVWTGLHEGWFSGRHVYRCGECEAYFFLAITSSSGQAGNSDYDDYTLTRRDPPAVADLDSENRRRETAQLLTVQCCQRGDLVLLEQLLDDERARLDVLKTLAALVTPQFPPSVLLERPAAADTRTAKSIGTKSIGIDLTPLEPRLRGFVSGPPDLAQAAARALARHLLHQARHDELQSLLASDGPVHAGALRALEDARVRDGGLPGEADAVRALMRHYVRTRAWKPAIELVEDHLTFRAAAQAIREIAQGVLDVDGPVDLSPLAPALVDKASRASQAPAWAGKDNYEAAAAALEALRPPGSVTGDLIPKPKWAETSAQASAADRKFLASLGAERPEPACKKPGCSRGTVSLSVLCRLHHFEMIRGYAWPHGDEAKLA